MDARARDCREVAIPMRGQRLGRLTMQEAAGYGGVKASMRIDSVWNMAVQTASCHRTSTPLKSVYECRMEDPMQAGVEAGVRRPRLSE
eukprot:2047160-Pleurochrysis_carterae.AAC.2